ncbi:MAG: hypothetical protein LH606_17410 [Cytophagaceae bacterium]|nr:hypothetical protein [Cytophagaceae bacterium]
MTDTRINLPPDENSSPFQTCRNQHQHWATTIVQDEREIDQLLILLADLPTQPPYRSLRHNAVDYLGDLNLLKSSFQRLRGAMVCDRVACTSTEQLPCSSPRLGWYTTLAVDSHLRTLTDEFNRIKEGCYQFLSGLVTLNLI